MREADGSAWREQRARAIAHHAAADQQRRLAESGQARAVVAEFAREARARGLRVTALRASSFSGRGSYRTGLRGWYVHPNRLLAVDVGGRFYLLGVPASLRSRFTGVHVGPQDPKLVVGEGGRDGESIPLRTLLRMRLDAGDDWP
ncbi:MAG: hypothetical protein V7603_4905 [Micromonosporaceae bacterium]|jgi:hypothetical protein